MRLHTTKRSDRRVKMSKTEALLEIIYDARNPRRSLTSYKRVSKAIRALCVDPNPTLARLGYVRHDNFEPYDWLAIKLEGKK